MKRQFKALTLALALLTTTACGSNEAKVSNQTRAGQSQVSESKELKVANVDTPKANAIETKKEDNRSYLIPQTVGLKDEEKVDKSQAKEEVVESKENTDLVEVIEEVAEENEVANDQRTEEVIELAYNEDAKESFVGQDEENIEYETVEEAEIEATTVFEEENEEVIELAYNEDEIKSLPEESELVEEKVQTQVSSASSSLEESSKENESEEENEEQEEQIEENIVAGGLTISSPSVEEVKSYWKNYQSKANDTADFYGINLINPSSTEVFGSKTKLDLNNIELGALSQAAQEDALHIANTARFASGIKSELRYGESQAQYAQAATVVNRLNLQVSHNPSQPNGLDANNFQLAVHGAANSNLASNFGLLESVVEYLKDDVGQINQTEVGHRRWVLNPAETTVGFGQTDEFSAMFVNNNDYAGENANTVYAYPGETAISEFHSAGSSLSLMFGENFDLTNATVEVKDLATGEVNTAANIDESFKGNTKALTFGYGMNYEAGTKLEVKVSGVTKDGQEYPIEYTINYMSLR